MARKILNISGAALTALVLAVVLPLTLPKLFGLQLYQVLSGSMEPELAVNSVIYVKPCDPNTLQVGDIITFTLDSGTDLVESHRIVSIDPFHCAIITKGDANAANDQTPVLFDNVVGKVLFYIPILGLLSQWIHTGPGIAACVAVFALILILWLLADRHKPKEKMP